MMGGEQLRCPGASSASAVSWRCSCADVYVSVDVHVQSACPRRIIMQACVPARAPGKKRTGQCCPFGV